MIKKNNLFKNLSILFCLVPMLILSLFCFVPTLNNSKDFNVHAADEVVTNFTFYGSNFITPISWTYNMTEYNYTSFMTVNCSFSYRNGEYYAGVSGDVIRSGLYSSYHVSGESNSYLRDDITSTLFLSGHPEYFYEFNFLRHGNVTSDINRVVFSHSYVSGEYLNSVTYYDSSSNYIRFSFVIWDNPNIEVYEPFFFEERIYYINVDFNDNEYYQAGYTDGYNYGLSDGSSSGYDDGYSVGHTIGYDSGYSAGLVAGGDYTFMSLIGAVIDAPVSAFTSLLNFEILGINLLGFITGLITLSIIIFIIKLCLGGK